jgi:hypothetical protein
MTDTVDNLILDLLEWLGSGPRPYGEVLDAWRTSCPRLPVWEEANDRGYVDRHSAPGLGQSVSVSEIGAAHLRGSRHQELGVALGAIGSPNRSVGQAPSGVFSTARASGRGLPKRSSTPRGEDPSPPRGDLVLPALPFTDTVCTGGRISPTLDQKVMT